MLLERLVQVLADATHRVPRIDPGAPQLDLALVDARDVEEVVHEPGEVLRLAVEDGARAPSDLAVRRRPLEQRDAVAEGGQRGPQLVRQHREELRLAAGLHAQRVLGLLPCGDVLSVDVHLVPHRDDAELEHDAAVVDLDLDSPPCLEGPRRGLRQLDRSRAPHGQVEIAEEPLRGIVGVADRQVARQSDHRVGILPRESRQRLGERLGLLALGDVDERPDGTPRRSVLAPDRRRVPEEVAHRAIVEDQIELEVAELPSESGRRLDGEIVALDLRSILHGAEVRRPLPGRSGDRHVGADRAAQQLGTEAVGIDLAALGVACDPDRRRDRVEHGLELGGAGHRPALALQDGRLPPLAVGDVSEDDLDRDLVPVREGGGDDLDVAHLAVEPDDPFLQEWDGPAGHDGGDPLANDGVIGGMEEVHRRAPDEVGGVARPEEPCARGVRQGDLPGAIQEDGVRRDLDEVSVAAVVPGHGSTPGERESDSTKRKSGGAPRNQSRPAGR